MSREQAIAYATGYFDDGSFGQVLGERVAHRTESQASDNLAALQAQASPPRARRRCGEQAFDLAPAHGDRITRGDRSWLAG